MTIFYYRHSGMDSRQAILPDALRVNANLFPTDLCRNPVAMDGNGRIEVFHDKHYIDLISTSMCSGSRQSLPG
jgi:hypothetical protein